MKKIMKAVLVAVACVICVSAVLFAYVSFQNEQAAETRFDAGLP
jgi:hypothetical protein